MLSFVFRRLGISIVLLFFVLTVTFFVIHIAPGEPSVLLEDPRIAPQQRERLYHFYGLDQPIGVQYVQWLTAVLRGDWGTSLTENRPAAQILLDKLPNTLLLAGAAASLEYGLGILLGLLAAARRNSALDHSIRVISLLLFAIPSFLLALIAIELLTVRWPIFPTSQMSSDAARNLPFWGQALDVLHHLILPASVWGLSRCGGVARFVRNGVLEVLGQDYIRTAKAKGLGTLRILWVHALRNALGPIVQRLGMGLPLLVSGSVILEVIFAWPGLGLTIFQAIQLRDYPVILASTMLAGAVVVGGTLLADVLHAWIDPRLREAR